MALFRQPKPLWAHVSYSCVTFILTCITYTLVSISQSSSILSRFYILSSASFIMFPEPWKDDVCVLLKDEHPTITFAQLTDHPRASLLTTIWCKEELLWPRLRAALMCVYKQIFRWKFNDLSFWKIKVVSSPLVPVTFPMPFTRSTGMNSFL